MENLAEADGFRLSQHKAGGACRRPGGCVFFFLQTRKRRTRAPVLTGGPGAASGGVASKSGRGHMHVQRGVVSYSPCCGARRPGRGPLPPRPPLVDT